MKYLDEFKTRARPNIPVFTDPGRVSPQECHLLSESLCKALFSLVSVFPLKSSVYFPFPLIRVCSNSVCAFKDSHMHIHTEGLALQCCSFFSV